MMLLFLCERNSLQVPSRGRPASYGGTVADGRRFKTESLCRLRAVFGVPYFAVFFVL